MKRNGFEEDGQRKLEECCKPFFFDLLADREKAFLSDMQYKGIKFHLMTVKQKSWVLEIHNKLRAKESV